ncbi:putative O-methyltransferase [Whalleya microplaca]|nr:putative O-methyltransferase [Whalleya microplaca]
MPKNVEPLVDLLDNVQVADLEGQEPARLRLIAAARKLASRLETNEEKAHLITIGQPATFAALQTCVDVGLWNGWTAAGGGEKSLENLARLTEKDCDANLLTRLLRLLSAANIVDETSEDRYKPTPFSLSIGDNSTHIAQFIYSRTHHWTDCHKSLPNFLARTSYREPRDSNQSSYIDGNPDGLDFFARCLSNQAYQDSFSGNMTSWAKYKVPWPEFYDTASLIDGADLSAGQPLIVDIGGHHGVDLGRVLDKHPDLPSGSLVLQDLADVVSGAKITTDKIKVMPHSFFDAQPVYGSRAYFFHAVFHDWAHPIAVQILRNVAPAMKKGYSKLLICDILIPPTGASIYQASMDMHMMAVLSAYERTEAQWGKLIDEAGFKIVKLWKDPRAYETLIEAELV